MMLRWLVLILSTLALISAVYAQEEEYPHGDFSEDCGLCHSSENWKPIDLRADFDHESYGLQLEGAHRDLYCGFCHTSMDFTLLDATCSQCHTDVHHGELGEECRDCHGFDSFTSVGDQLRMHRLTSFPLTDSHLTVDCESCHPPTPEGIATFRLTASDCQDCHFQAYLTADPDHETSGFGTDCEICHRPSRWEDGYFNHSILVASGQRCFECHQDDYDRTTDPVHVDAGFPIDCEACHGTRGWDGAFFEHEGFFPIRSEPHSEARDCTECHTVATDYSQFFCLGCHPHDDRIETDGHHDEDDIVDYEYESTRCFECHPRGRS